MLGELVIDELAHTTRLRVRLLELTYKEFELFKHLGRHGPVGAENGVTLSDQRLPEGRPSASSSRASPA